MKTTRVFFENRNGQKLAARLEMPVGGRPRAFALFAHCFTCTKNLHAIVNISRALTMQGFGVLRFDFTGLGESEGDFEETNFTTNIHDLEAAADFLKQNHQPPSVLIGHSLGGAAVIFAAARIPKVKAVVTIAAPSSPAHLKDLLSNTGREVEKEGSATVTIGGSPFTITKQLFDDLEEQNIKKTLAGLDAALLLMHSPQDKTVKIDNATALYRMARQPKSFISLDGADHLLSDKRDSYYAGSLIGTWAAGYTGSTGERPAGNRQVMARLSGEKYITELHAGKHNLLADEPETSGGDDMGPSPYELVTAGLGACTSITLRMYASRKKWDLKEVRVFLDHHKKHADDCATCDESDASKIDQFDRIIELDGDLDEKQRHRLLEIANKCPVHRTLTGDIYIETKLR